MKLSLLTRFSLLLLVCVAPLWSQETSEEEPHMRGAPVHEQEGELAEEHAPGTEPPEGMKHDAILELPEWSPEDVREFDHNEAPQNLGGGLWPEEWWPTIPPPPRLPVLPDSLKQPDPGTAGSEPLPVPSELHPFYFGEKPPEPIVDPQGLVPDVTQDELCDLLEDWSQRSGGIPARILLLQSHQSLPAEVSLAALAEKWFPDGRGVVAVYHFGLPLRSQLEAPRALRERFPDPALTKSLESSIREAMVVGQPGEQFNRFCIKLGVRLYQMEREPVAGTKPSQGKRAPSVAAKQSPTGRTWLWGLIAAALLAGGGMWFWRTRGAAADGPGPWLLPEQEFPLRLGGEHTGGHCAVWRWKT